MSRHSSTNTGQNALILICPDMICPNALTGAQKSSKVVRPLGAASASIWRAQARSEWAHCRFNSLANIPKKPSKLIPPVNVKIEASVCQFTKSQCASNSGTLSWQHFAQGSCKSGLASLPVPGVAAGFPAENSKPRQAASRFRPRTCGRRRKT